MRLENDELIYRSRFEIEQDGSSESAYSMILRELWGWLKWKEQKRQDKKWQNMFLELDKPASFEEFKESGLAIPLDYNGGAASGEKNATMLCVRSFSDAEGRQYWAMEYDEPGGGREPWRHWHTRIGLSADKEGGSCLVNIYLSYYNVSSFYASGQSEGVSKPSATVPNFVKRILTKDREGNPKEGYRVSCGTTDLLTKPVYLTADTFDSFSSSLLDPGRQIPLVLLATDWEGRTPVDDADNIADSVLGMANVYVVDWRDLEQREKSLELFRYRTAAYDYRCFNDTLRIYQPHIDLNNRSDRARHPYFTKMRIESICKNDSERNPNASFKDILNRSLSQSIGRDDRDIVDLNDLRRKKDQQRLKESQARLSELMEKMVQRSKEDRAADLSVQVSQGAAAQLEIENLKNELDEWMGIATELDADNKHWREECEDLKSENSNLDSKVGELRYLMGAADERADAAEEETELLKDSSKKLEDVSVGLASDLKDLLKILEALCSSKVIILPEAWKSAEDFHGEDLDEYWEILKSVPDDLWDIYFGDKDYGGRIDDEYHSRTGYDHAMTEKKLTKANSKLAQQRKRMYNGRDYEIMRHIKGKDTNPKFMFRLYYDVDWDEKKIVIGHCGEHMDTAGTSKIH